MRHNLETVADNFHLDKQKLTEFALKPENYNKYGIINDNGYITTSTAFTDKLVEDFKKWILKQYNNENTTIYTNN